MRQCNNYRSALLSSAARQAIHKPSPEEDDVLKDAEGDQDDGLEQQEWMLLRTHLKSLCGHY